MRASEVGYWDNNFKSLDKNMVTDNVWKRQQLLKKLLTHDFIGSSVLEIGVGFGTVAFIFQRLYLSTLKYVGTDVSHKVCEFLRNGHGIDMVHTDITKLPKIEPDGFDYIIALDVLEHINPKDRELGYDEMYDSLSDGGLILINNPLDESNHDGEFDYGLDDKGIANMCGDRFELSIKAPYSVKCKQRVCNYEWIEMRKI